jgi:hypothetical protein
MRRRDEIFFSSSRSLDRIWDPISLLFGKNCESSKCVKEAGTWSYRSPPSSEVAENSCSLLTLPRVSCWMIHEGENCEIGEEINFERLWI